MILLFILIYIYFIESFRYFFEKNLVIEESIFNFKNKLDFYLNLVYFIFFILYFLFYIRLLGIFFKKDFYLNLNDLVDNLILKCYGYISILIIFLMFLMLFLYIFNYIIFFFAKKSFLKLHYYLLFSNRIYANFIISFSYLDLYIFRTLKYKYLYNLFYFLIFYGFKIFIFIFLIKSIVFDNGIIYLGFIPYYSSYYFFLRIYDFLCKKFNYDFDLAIAKKYYPDIYFFIKVRSCDIFEYQKFLLLGYSDYYFVDSIYLDFPWLIKSNWLLCDTFKYTLNKYPYDFHSKIEGIKPKFIINI